MLYRELVDYNKNVNLTAITNEEEFAYKHILDSLIPSKVFYNGAKVIDVGAGAGFPTIPLKILNSSLDITCVDSVNKKVDWLNHISKTLKLSLFTAIHTRCEDLADKAEYRESFDICTARAVAGLSTLIEYCVPFTKLGGLFVAYKGSDYENELRDAKNAINELGVELIDKILFEDEKLGNRCVLIFKKIKKTPFKYPRKQNKPRIKPL